MSDTKSSAIQQHSSGVDAACKPSSHQLAAELIEFAENLLAQPDIETHKAFFPVQFLYEDKDLFLALCRALPRPLAKKYVNDDLEVSHDTPSLQTYIRVKRSVVCQLVEPAKPAVYRCDPLLSAEEEAEISEASNG